MKKIIILVIALLMVFSASAESPLKQQLMNSEKKFLGSDWWKGISPLDFIDILIARANQGQSIVEILESPPSNWIKKSHIHELMKLVDSKEPAAHVLSLLSSYIPPDYSTVGDEAIFLIEGFIKGKYPPALCSGKGDPEKIRQWYNNWEKNIK